MPPPQGLGKYTGYEIDGTDVSITAAGTYVFSGDCDNGSITVKKRASRALPLC